METTTQVAHAIQWILGPVSDEVAEDTGFTQRTSKITGSAFVQTLVFSSLDGREWSYSQLSNSAMQAGVAVTRQGLQQRFGKTSAALTQGVLERAVQTVLSSQRQAIPLLERFTGVYLLDSSVVSLPKALEDVWPGSVSSHGSSAGIKLHVRLEVCSGQLGGPILAAGREHDRRSPFEGEALPVGALRMGDLGFYSLTRFADDDQAGIFWLSRYKRGTTLMDLAGQPINLLAWLRQQTETQFERWVQLGRKQPLRCRLLVERVPAPVVEQRKRKLREYACKKQTPLTDELLALAEWTLILTNIPPVLLSIPEALVLLRVRWQIELLFKRWKSLLEIDTWRSADPWRILTELFAKLLAAVLQQWVLLTAMPTLSRPSFWKAMLLIRRFATPLALALPSFADLYRLLSLIARHLQRLCHLDTRRARPSTYQLLECSAVQP